MSKYSIQQVSRSTKLKTHVLRYYEKEGLIPFVKRSKNGIRQYSEENIEWIGLIRCLKNTGMSIKQIKDFVDLSLHGERTLKQRCDMLKEHKAAIESQIEQLQNNLELVEWKINYFSEQYERSKKWKKTVMYT